MGVDIHVVVEQRFGDKWIAINTMLPHIAQVPNLDGERDSSPLCLARNYKRFAALAGVRGEGPEPRGIPKDVSETSQCFIDVVYHGGHHHSWLGIYEAAQIFLATENEPPNPKSHAVEHPTDQYFDQLIVDDEYDDYRVIFWFSS